MAAVTITGFGLQAGTQRVVYATWNWAQEHTKGYNVRWYYDTGDTNGSGTIWFIGDDSTVNKKQSTYTAPSNAKRVRFVVQPVSETYTSNNTEVSYWTADWSTERIYGFESNVPTTPSAPEVILKNYLLTASLNNSDTDATIIQFQVLKDNSTIFATAQVTIEGDYKYAEYSCYVDAGSEYKVRCRGCRNSLYSEWSEYSNKVVTIPATPSGFTECKAKTSTSVYLEWAAVNTAESYDIEYATEKDYFDSSDKTTTINGIKSTRYEKTGLENGDTYFFRLRAVNDSGESPWSEISSVVVGKSPEAPTTWSSTTTVVTGEPLTLYWVHNSEDGSSQVRAELELTINGTATTYTIENTTDEDEKDKTSFYTIDTSEFLEGNKLLWRVRTCGVTEVYGDWSIQRTVDVYTPPTLTLIVTNSNGEAFETLTNFPIKVKGTAGPTSQTAIGYHLTVMSNDSYKTVDSLGNSKYVNKGDVIYSRYFDNSRELSTTLSASELSLENNMSYTITCVVSMNSGLTAESSSIFKVAWGESQYFLNCKISINKANYSVAINPYCKNSSGEFVDDVTLAVYRREFDGKFTELASNVDNVRNMFINDPHPALDYARYRIVATSKTTGQVEYYDVPAKPVGGKAAIIQWDEAWSDFDATITDTLASPVWSGSMLQLPYNIDVTEGNNRDVELVEYIGREHPISYHGTQLGTSLTWKTDIPKTDVETIYALRRLQNWAGDVYIREPSGNGYWAVVTISFNINHCTTVIPVSISITRVEGGI